MSTVRGRPFPWLPYAITLVLIILFAVFPILSVWIVYLIADPNGCRVDEAGVYPCIVNGTDIGGLLAFMGVLGWLMLATVPMGGTALLFWGIALLSHIIYRRYKADRDRMRDPQ
ncbi:hypothetical protein [Pelagibacterium luteolum]|uniref:Uncharacterized protein n=1 Tax=Pelagibacterium luteolum TaxID=440168 RepID=A0A1G7SJ28_9HYPH|nr:hypothetical protein [Pelagibacterium luteolum]SDG22902.1 hypothetical protein SAMN04487974_101536 [Pelagibacterium luteolum]